MTESEIKIAAERLKLENTISKIKRKIQVENWALETAEASMRLLEKDPEHYFILDEKIKEIEAHISR